MMQMKKLSILKLAAAMSALVLSGMASAQPEISYQGNRLNYTNFAPYQDGAVVYAPLILTAEKLGAKVETRGNEYTLRLGPNKLIYPLGSITYVINRARITMVKGSIRRDGIIFVPTIMFESLAGNEFRVRQKGGHRPPVVLRPATVLYNNVPLAFAGYEQPITKGNTILVPFDSITAKLGLRTSKSTNGRRLWVYYGNDQVQYDRGSLTYLYNREVRKITAVSAEEHGIVFVPIGILQHMLGNRLIWRR